MVDGDWLWPRFFFSFRCCGACFSFGSLMRDPGQSYWPSSASLRPDPGQSRPVIHLDSSISSARWVSNRIIEPEQHHRPLQYRIHSIATATILSIDVRRSCCKTDSEDPISRRFPFLAGRRRCVVFCCLFFLVRWRRRGDATPFLRKRSCEATRCCGDRESVETRC